MVKFIPTKRATKSVQVDDYWRMREKTKPIQAQIQKKGVQVDLSTRYKFKSFKKEIKKIDVSLSHFIDEIKIQPYSQTDDNLGSYFLDELEQQNAQCKAPHYKRFYAQVIELSQSLPLVLHNLDYIISLIIDNISLPEQERIKNQKPKIIYEESLDEEQQNDPAILAFEEQEEDEDEDEIEDAITLNQKMQREKSKMLPEEEPEIEMIRRRIMTPYMLQLLPELIRDCQHFAYIPFVERIFLTITNLIDLKNLTMLQLIYKVLAYALKYFFPEITSKQNLSTFCDKFKQNYFNYIINYYLTLI